MYIRPKEVWNGISIVEEGGFITADNNREKAKYHPKEIRFLYSEARKLQKALNQYFKEYKVDRYGLSYKVKHRKVKNGKHIQSKD
jgi:hypothetical protein